MRVGSFSQLLKIILPFFIVVLGSLIQVTALNRA